jgi:hypothetical protein
VPNELSREWTGVNEPSVADLYLELLERVLTNTLFSEEPNPDQEDEVVFAQEFIQHYFRSPAISMLPVGRFANMRYCIEDVIRNGVPGDLIETGVWRGGATIFMRGVLRAHGVNDRTVWVADSFEGLPEPDPVKFPKEARMHNSAVMVRRYNRFAVGFEEVRRNFAAFDLLDDNVRFLPGWFKDTLPTAPIETLALMRLDGDYYESTMDSLTNLYDKLSPGGYVIIDDYGHDSWCCCRQAVDEFRGQRGIMDPMIRVDSKCYYWQRHA